MKQGTVYRNSRLSETAVSLTKLKVFSGFPLDGLRNRVAYAARRRMRVSVGLFVLALLYLAMHL